MPVQEWSDSVLLVEFQDDPAFTDDVNSALEIIENQAQRDVVLNFGDVSFLNSSNIAKLLKLRKLVAVNQGLRICRRRGQRAGQRPNGPAIGLVSRRALWS